MGKWDRRWIPRRRYNNKKYRDYDYEEPPPSPPSPHHSQSNPPPILENSGASWEVDFCKSVRVPWKKILAAKNFMYCHENVVKWDDSAAEEAFHEAKRRYWEKINCIPCETPLPHEDIYIDEINWNLYIDPKQISDLDQEYFNPDEVVKAHTSWTTVESHNSVVPVRHLVENDENPDKIPRESDAAQGAEALSNTIQWGNNIKSINSKDVTNPWERNCTVVDKSLRNNTWRGSADKDPTLEDGNRWVQTAKAMDSRDVNNPWELSHVQCDESSRNNAWNGSSVKDPAQGVRTQLGQNAKPINLKDVNNPWEQSLSKVGISLTNAWKGCAGVDPQGVRTCWGLNNNTRKESEVEKTPKRVGPHCSQYADSINPKDVNHYAQSCTPGDESLRYNAWKGSQEESWRWRKESRDNSWTAGNYGDKKWVRVDNRSRGPRQWNTTSQEQQYPVNSKNTWQQRFPSHAGLAWGSRWSERGNNSGVEEQPQIHNEQSKNIYYKGARRGGRIEQSGCRKREGSLQHSPRHKTSRFQGDSYMTTQKWQ